MTQQDRNKQLSNSVRRQQGLGVRKSAGTIEPRDAWSRKMPLDEEASLHARILAAKLRKGGHTGPL